MGGWERLEHRIKTRKRGTATYFPTPKTTIPVKNNFVFRRLPESLHALACPSKSQVGGRDPASSIEHPASSNEYQASRIQHREFQSNLRVVGT